MDMEEVSEWERVQLRNTVGVRGLKHKIHEEKLRKMYFCLDMAVAGSSRYSTTTYWGVIDVTESDIYHTCPAKGEKVLLNFHKFYSEIVNCSYMWRVEY